MAETTDHLAPDASPSGVRRVNNLPLYIIGGLLGIFLFIMMVVAADRATQQNSSGQSLEGSKEKVGNASLYAKEITGDRIDGIIPPASPPPVPESLQTATLALPITHPDNLAAPSTPEKGDLQEPIRMDERDRIRMTKLQRLEEAVKAKTSVQMTAPRSAGSAPSGVSNGSPVSREDVLANLVAVRQKIDAAQRDDPTAAYQTRLARMRGMGQDGGGVGIGGSSTSPALFQNASSGARNSTMELGRSSEGDRWKLDSKPEAPRSPYELRAGFIVPATLISGINSDLPGQIMAQVAQNVYDTPTGKYLLIPQGARLVGNYSSEIVYGQSRVLIAWQRIIFPDGKAMDIGSMPGADSAGYSGFNDQVNNHYARVFGSAFLMSAVVAGINLSQSNTSSGNGGERQRASDALSEALGQQLGQVTAQMIAKNLNIAPTLEIRPGYRFNIIATKDMTFSTPYQAFDY